MPRPVVSTSSPLGLIVRERREELGLSRDELAERARVSPSTVKNLEQGRHHPTRVTRQSLAKALDLPELVAPAKALLEATDPAVLGELLGRYNAPTVAQALRLAKLDLWSVFVELFPAAVKLVQAVARVDLQTLAQEQQGTPRLNLTDEGV